MLKQRLLTAAVLLPLVIGMIFFADSGVFAALLAVVILAAAWEWTGLMQLARIWQRGVYMLLIAVILLLAESVRHDAGQQQAILSVAVIFWVLVTIWVFWLNRHPAAVNSRQPVGLLAAIGVLVLIPAWLALVYLHGLPGNGAWQVLLVMALVWSADSGAYFAGRRWGRHKLAAAISPGKTWEGVLGGVMAASLLALLTVSLDSTRFWQTLSYLVLCLLVVLISIVGDLLESLVKRQARVKDSGRLLPGHGGVLDRVDSLLAAAPLYAFGLTMMGRLP